MKSNIFSGNFIKSEKLEWEKFGEGIVRQILGYDEGLMMVRVKFEKGAVGYVHSHPHRQVTLVEKGKFEITINETKEILETGDSFFAEPNIQHGALCLEEGILVDVFSPVREDFLKDKI